MSNIVSTDPIADMLARMRNAIAVRKAEVQLPHSKLKAAVAELLKANGFIDSVRTDEADGRKTLVIRLRNEAANAKITEITRLSTPGHRHYVGASEIPMVKHGRGLIVISTAKGLMTGDQARTQHIGGELICKVY